MIKAYFDGMCEFAWQAGIVDGEGCLTIGINRRKGRPNPNWAVSISVSNTDMRILQPFQDMWEGYLVRNRESRNNWKEAYAWNCPIRNAEKFLKSILPFLRAKQNQAEILLLYIARKKSFKRISLGQGKGSLAMGKEEVEFRTDLWNKIRILNQKGKFSRSQEK